MPRGLTCSAVPGHINIYGRLVVLLLKRQKSMRGDAGYFLVKFKKKQIKVVNAEAMELRSIEKIVRLIMEWES